MKAAVVAPPAIGPHQWYYGGSQDTAETGNRNLDVSFRRSAARSQRNWD